MREIIIYSLYHRERTPSRSSKQDLRNQYTNITLAAHDRRPVQITLEVGLVTDVVTVTSEAPLIQDSPTGQALVSGNQVTELPLNNRNFIRLLGNYSRRQFGFGPTKPDLV